MLSKTWRDARKWVHAANFTRLMCEGSIFVISWDIFGKTWPCPIVIALHVSPIGPRERGWPDVRPEVHTLGVVSTPKKLTAIVDGLEVGNRWVTASFWVKGVYLRAGVFCLFRSTKRVLY